MTALEMLDLLPRLVAASYIGQGERVEASPPEDFR